MKKLGRPKKTESMNIDNNPGKIMTEEEVANAMPPPPPPPDAEDAAEVNAYTTWLESSKAKREIAFLDTMNEILLELKEITRLMKEE